ncbi:RPM1-interacting protein 4 [Citrus sinensis]|uniref:RPM1-interacting protein 4 n=1 Tax=Citrus clementina TaxID=85681 RepID=UPI000CECF112|nr:RPM1-interacting protein 4 [Citrus x clementina]XP_006493080.2 RPM1-interacting protein 4-like [Citrus sinensis]KAH9649754.1 RPM1-interacting protein 4 [Citrus sinensis]
MAVSRYNHVPKFGNWETEEHVPYSLYFDEARKRRNAAKINPNDTHENQNTISDNLASIKTSTFETETKSGAQNGREDGDLRRPTESPWYHHTVNIEVAINSLVHRPGRKMTTRQQNAGFDSRIGRSPISPWRNYSTGCSQRRSVTQGAETTDHTAPVPEFGDWDEPDPTSADGYTYIFNQVREERLKGTGNVAAAATPGKPHYKDLKKHKNEAFKKCCCFPVPW